MIRIAQPLIGDEEREAVLAVLDSGQLANGAGDQGARGPLRREVSRHGARPSRSRTARRRCTWRCWRTASAPATR